jgi:hypothetical protein
MKYINVFILNYDCFVLEFARPRIISEAEQILKENQK